MRRYPAVRFCLLLIVATVLSAGVARGDDSELAGQIDELVTQLDSDSLSERDLAESNLLRLAGVGGEKFLALLPRPNDNMPPAVRERLTAVRKTVEERMARAAIEASAVTLDAVNWPLDDVLAELEKQSGNKIIDQRRQMGGEVTNPAIVVQVQNAPFWAAMDQVLDAAKLSPYPYAGDDALALTTRDPGVVDRAGRGSYTGPFRFEVTEVTATRGLRNPTNQSLYLDLEIAWEPRLRPIALALPLDYVEATGDPGRLPVGQPGRVFNVEVQEGTSASTLNVPFELPKRSTESIARLTGTVTALVPGKREEFRFEDLRAKQPVTESRGGVHVTFERVVQNGAIWEVHMRLKLDDDNDALASHRGWVFNNLTYLVGEDGEPIDHAGFETTRQTQNEVGIAYLFDLPDGIDGLAWVYESPVSIVERSYEFELEDIELP